jgi:hypothetical protein
LAGKGKKGTEEQQERRMKGGGAGEADLVFDFEVGCRVGEGAGDGKR